VYPCRCYEAVVHDRRLLLSSPPRIHSTSAVAKGGTWRDRAGLQFTSAVTEMYKTPLSLAMENGTTIIRV